MKLLRIDAVEGLFFIRPENIMALMAHPESDNAETYTALIYRHSSTQENQIFTIIGHVEEIAAALERLGEFEISRLESFG